MATYTFHRIIMEKGRLTVLSVSLGIFSICLQKCLLSNPLCFISVFFSKSPNLIGFHGDLRRYAANNWQISTSCLYLVE